MPTPFAAPIGRRHKPGRLFVGRSNTLESFEVGIPLERHATLTAGSRAGKGTSVIIPNLLRWPHNAVVIDPKGENAEITAAFRAKKFGQQIAIIDPFNSAHGVDQYRRSFNPLDLVRDERDIMKLAESMIEISPSESQKHFPQSAEAVLSGLIAFILQDDELFHDDERNLGMLPELMRQLAGTNRDMLIKRMGMHSGFGRLSQEAASRLSRDTNELASVMSTLATQLKWLTPDEMKEALKSSSDFDLHDLKYGHMTLYLVLPFSDVRSNPEFLRLFVTAALLVMEDKDGAAQKGRECLFILDEFYSLGTVGLIREAAGSMPSYGVHLLPVVQNLGQIVERYGEKGLQTFISDADAQIFFGNGDPYTLQEIQKALGEDPRTGRPLLSAQDIRQMVHKPTNAKTARRMIVIDRGNKAYMLRPAPYFSWRNEFSGFFVAQMAWFLMGICIGEAYLIYLGYKPDQWHFVLGFCALCVPTFFVFRAFDPAAWLRSRQWIFMGILAAPALVAGTVKPLFLATNGFPSGLSALVYFGIFLILYACRGAIGRAIWSELTKPPTTNLR